MEWKKLRESSFLPVDKLAISAISKELQYKWARLKMQIYVIGLMALIGLFCRLMLVHLHQFYSFVHCVAGKNLYNNEHVAVKLVSFLFTFSVTQLTVVQMLSITVVFRILIKLRCQFPPGTWVRTQPLLRHGCVGSKHWWTRPSFGKVNKSVTDVSVMSPGMLVIAFHFSPLLN